MKTNFSEMRKALQGRWKQSWYQVSFLVPVTQAFNSSLSVVEVLMAKSAEMRASKKYSELGYREEVRALALDNVVPILKRNEATIRAAYRELQARKARLALPKPDPTNAAEASIRSEMRALLRERSPAQAMQLLVSADVDPRMIQAVLEAPPLMSGLTEDAVDTVREQVQKRSFGAELALIEDYEEALTLANSANQIARYQLRQEAQYGGQRRRRI